MDKSISDVKCDKDKFKTSRSCNAVDTLLKPDEAEKCKVTSFLFW
jgi:hypothetical protein